MRSLLILVLLIGVVVIIACATIPTGPSVMVLPGTGKSFEQFRIDDALCRQFAYEQVGGKTAQMAAQNSAVSSAVIGTALGAAAGAAIGSASGEAGAGAAIGAGSGLIVGSAAGTGYATESYYEAQQRYDYAYLQCMYAKGNKIPVYGGYISRPSSAQPGSEFPPPPPANYPPPAPPE